MCALVKAIKPAVRPAAKTPPEKMNCKKLFMIGLSLVACLLIGRLMSTDVYKNSFIPNMLEDYITFSFHIQSDIVNMTIRLENRHLDEEGFDRNMWTFLHTIAATYPNDPSEKVQSIVQQCIKFLALVYPGEICADTFAEIILYHPPDTRSQKSFSKWMCEAHNVVNRKLGKPILDCSKVNEHWRPNCSGNTFRLLVTYDINII